MTRTPKRDARTWALAALALLCFSLRVSAAEPSAEWAALTAAEGLDVRDSQNRSVSREVVGQALGSAQRNHQNAVASSRERLLRAFFDQGRALLSSWREEFPPLRRLDLPGLILDPPRVAFFLLILTASALAAGASRLQGGPTAEQRSRMPAFVPLLR